MDNKPENNSASNQNELDFGLNQADPVTPKKSFEPNSSSFLNKFFGKKNTPQSNPFAERKEPTFGTATVASTTAAANQTVNYATNGVFNQPAQAIAKTFEHKQERDAEVVESTGKDKETEVESAVENSVEKTEELLVEEAQQETQPTLEESNVVTKPNMKNPENWAIMQKLPQKHRRLFIAIAGAVAVLVALVLLKPSSDTVENFQAGNNGNNMPIEFQSLDPNQPIENADMANTVQPAESPAVAETTPQVTATPEATTNITPTAEPAAQPESTPTMTSPVANAPTATPVKPEVAVDTNKEAQQAIREQQAKAAAEKAHQEQLLREQQAKARAEKLKAEQQAKATKAAQEKAKAEKLAAEKARAKAALNGAPITEAKPVSSKSTTTTPKAASVTSKTLTVPASTSLFQVFRSNGLDIRDVNAMTKANGVGNALSSFKAGDKVQVSTNSEGRVSSMRLSDGSVFTRQADGSYKYSK